MRRWVVVCLGVVGLCCMAGCAPRAGSVPEETENAESPPVLLAPAEVTWKAVALPAVDPVLSLEQQLGEVAARDAAPAEEDVPAPNTDLAGLAAEVAALRQDLARLRATTEQYLGMREAALRMENERLRLQLESLRAGRNVPADVPFSFTPPVTAAPEASSGQAASASEFAVATAGDLTFAIIKRWDSSTPNKNGATHRFICSVPPGTSEERLSKLVDWLAASYSAGDTVTVDLFDDTAAAQRYAADTSKEPERRILHAERPKR